MAPGSADVILDADTAAELLADPSTLDLEGTDPFHAKGWTLQRNSATGIFTATSPDGRQFTRSPKDRCRP